LKNPISCDIIPLAIKIRYYFAVRRIEPSRVIRRRAIRQRDTNPWDFSFRREAQRFFLWAFLGKVLVVWKVASRRRWRNGSNSCTD
jgi:hypothetical protein